MTYKYRLPLLVVLALAVALVAAGKDDLELDWKKTFKEAEDASKKEGKPILAYYYQTSG